MLACFKDKGFSLLELMVVVAIICILAVIGVTSYRAYTIKASIGALIPAADKVKDEVEDMHNTGTIFGSSYNQVYVASTLADKPPAMQDLKIVAYGCVDIDINLSALNLDGTQQLTLSWCPYVDNGSIEWQCGYDPASYSAYLQYLPANCQTINTAIQDTSF